MTKEDILTLLFSNLQDELIATIKKDGALFLEFADGKTFKITVEEQSKKQKKSVSALFLL